MDHEEIASSWIGDAATTRSEVRRQIRSDDAPLIASQNNDHIFSKISLSSPLNLRISGFPYAITFRPSDVWGISQ